MDELVIVRQFQVSRKRISKWYLHEFVVKRETKTRWSLLGMTKF